MYIRTTGPGRARTAATVACILSALAATPALAQTSSSNANVFDYLSSPSGYKCQQASGTTPGGSSANCSGTAVTNGIGSASSASNNASRTASASTALTATGLQEEASSQAYSVQDGTIYVTGTPSSTDNVVFHFLTPIGQGAATGHNNDFGSSSLWELALAAAGGSSSTTSEYKRYYGNGTSDPTSYGSNTHVTAGGVDFTVPFSEFGNTNLLSYIFEAYVEAGNTAGSASASITAILNGADAVDAQGHRIASASFNADGTGTLDLPSITTTPEPSSLALLGTGLIGIAPLARRRLRTRVL